MEIDGWPWWPARVVDRKDALAKIAVTLIDDMPPPRKSNAMVEFFNWDEYVEVVDKWHMAEFTENIHLIKAEGITPGALQAAFDAHDWIMSDGNRLQRTHIHLNNTYTTIFAAAKNAQPPALQDTVEVDSESENPRAHANTSRRAGLSACPATKKASASSRHTKQVTRNAQSRALQDLLELSDVDSEPETPRVRNTVPSNAQPSTGPTAHRSAAKKPNASFHSTKSKRSRQTARMLTTKPQITFDLSDSDSESELEIRRVRNTNPRNPQPSAGPAAHRNAAKNLKTSSRRTKTKGTPQTARMRTVKPQKSFDMSDSDSESQIRSARNTAPSNPHLSTGPAAHRSAAKKPSATSHRTKTKRSRQTARMRTTKPQITFDMSDSNSESESEIRRVRNTTPSNAQPSAGPAECRNLTKKQSAISHRTEAEETRTKKRSDAPLPLPPKKKRKLTASPDAMKVGNDSDKDLLVSEHRVPHRDEHGNRRAGSRVKKARRANSPASATKRRPSLSNYAASRGMPSMMRQGGNAGNNGVLRLASGRKGAGSGTGSALQNATSGGNTASGNRVGASAVRNLAPVANQRREVDNANEKRMALERLERRLHNLQSNGMETARRLVRRIKNNPVNPDDPLGSFEELTKLNGFVKNFKDSFNATIDRIRDDSRKQRRSLDCNTTL